VTLRIDPGAPVAGDLIQGIWDLEDPRGVSGSRACFTSDSRHDDDLTDPLYRSWGWIEEAPELLVWAFALPSHREVAAAHAAPILYGGIEPPRFHGPIDQFVACLPDMQGPAGPGVNIAIICALTAHDPARRAAAVDALTGFAPTGDLDGAALGRQLGEDRAVIVSRVAAALQSAAEAGAGLLVWQVASAALPALLSSRTRDTHKLLTVAANAAAKCGISGHIDGLAETAAGPTANRLRAEARRLQDVLAGR
jgi:hypothetical protein